LERPNKILGSWKFIPHVDYAVGKGKMVIGQLSSLTCKRNKMTIKNKLVLYKSVIPFTITYASAACGYVSDAQLYKLQLQNEFLRKALNTPWFVRNDQLHRKTKLPMLREPPFEMAMRMS
jgi:hypothetical protein